MYLATMASPQHSSSMDFLKETLFGQFLRLVGYRPQWLQYPEERSGFEPRQSSILSEHAAKPSSQDPEKLEKVISTIKPEAFDSSDTKDIILVTWQNDEDPANPRNWSPRKKKWTLSIVLLYTWVVYCSASIVTPTSGYIQVRYGVSEVVTSLGLSMYVAGCKCRTLSIILQPLLTLFQMVSVR
jgi:hypothetical protein